MFDGKSVKVLEDIGWCLIYKGVRWIVDGGSKRSLIGYGLFILDIDNLERILYRTSEPLNNKLYQEEGWTIGSSVDIGYEYLDDIEKYIPSQVIFEIKRANKLINEGKHWKSHHTLWLQARAEEIIE